MPRCPVCRGEESRSVHAKDVEIRGSRYRYDVRYCPSCAVKFTSFTSTEEQEAVQDA